MNPTESDIMSNGRSPRRLEDALSDITPEEREHLRDIWHRMPDTDPMPQTDPDAIEETWRNLSAFSNPHAIDSSGDETDRKPDRAAVRHGRRKHMAGAWAAIGASAVLGVCVIWLWLQPVVHQAPYNERLRVQLPDGSEVELNSGSTLRHPRYFGNRRSVSLQGEAFFEVQKSDKPFTVSTFNAEVRVLGTSFNIKAWERSVRPVSIVTLQSGQIALASRDDPGRVIEMGPGQTRRVGAGPAPISTVDTVTVLHATAWRSGDLVFIDTRFDLILEDIERRFGIDLTMQADQVGSKEISMAFRQPAGAEEVIKKLCAGLGLRYRPTVRGYEIYRA